MADRGAADSASSQTSRHTETSERLPRIVTGSPPRDHRYQHHHRREDLDDDHFNQYRGGVHQGPSANRRPDPQTTPERGHLFSLPPIEAFQHRSHSPTVLPGRSSDHRSETRMNQFVNSGTGGIWQNSWQSKDGDGVAGFPHSSGSTSGSHQIPMSTETRNHQYSWSSGQPMPPLPFDDRTSVSAPIGPPQYPYHSSGPRSDPLDPNATGHPPGYQGPYLPPAQRFEQSVPPPRASQSVQSPHHAANIRLPLATSSSTPSTLMPNRYPPAPLNTAVHSTGVPNASPLLTMRALGEAVPSLPATSSKGLSRNTGAGSGTSDRDRERDRDRPRKRAKTRSGIGTGNGNGNGGPVKAGTSKEASVVDAKEMISAYCDELCHLAEGTVQGDSMTDSLRLSELSRQIVLKLSAVASDCGLDDLVITEQDLESGLEPLSLVRPAGSVRTRSGENVSTEKEGENGTQALNASRLVAKPTSVMNAQTPAEAARDMEFIRTRRDELNAKAAAAEKEKEKEGKDREELDNNGVGGLDLEPIDPDHDLIKRDLASPAKLSSAVPPFTETFVALPARETTQSTASPLQLQASIAPIQRHPYRLSTYEPFMPFPYMMTAAVSDAPGMLSPRQSVDTGLTSLVPTPHDYQTNLPLRTCHSCGVVQATEWKLGPDGPDTLCAVCGTHWLQQAQTWLSLPPYKSMSKVGGGM
ncbi:hypothetical protein HD553DRAFT_109856 [Filobasidium floriforme]|uniref:uncharacterized protein n=1 Tax=Filobasidium floriforme TaxID=5210 RepID=UPI001E8E9BE4|nr:uncharacterized protein HD553DRAFT_109856 [Filobasidium floriforme]KAH8080932.1 hypothetical protein HD553DRAFT_109856 [Filobasidium floriforme]